MSGLLCWHGGQRAAALTEALAMARANPGVHGAVIADKALFALQDAVALGLRDIAKKVRIVVCAAYLRDGGMVVFRSPKRTEHLLGFRFAWVYFVSGVTLPDVMERLWPPTGFVQPEAPEAREARP